MNSKRIINLDIIRVLAMLMVVVMHTLYNFTLRTDFFNTKLWFIFEPIIALSKTCVLLFFMLSGYLVVNKKRSVKENWKRTKKRILVPLLSFSLLNMFYELYKFNFEKRSVGEFIQRQMVRITDFPSSPLWFLVALFYFYLLNPVWGKIFNNKESKNIAIYITKMSLMLSIVSTLVKFPGMKEHTLFNNFTGWIGYLFFYFYGALAKNKWVNVYNKRINYLLITFGFLFTFIGDYITSFTTAKNINFVWTNYTGNFLSFPVVMLSIGVFNLLLAGSFKSFGLLFKKIIEWFAGVSFGIYLIHTFIVSFLTDILRFRFDNLSMNVYLYNIINFSIVFIASTIIAYVLKITPKLKALVGE
ncbi:acyltransferase [Patescibacteria group bacterium]